MRKSPEFLPNEITIRWHIDDIKNRDESSKLSDNDCRAILNRIERTHDAEVGINWDVIDAHIEMFLFEKENGND